MFVVFLDDLNLTYFCLSLSSSYYRQLPTLLFLSGYKTSNKTSCTTVSGKNNCIFPFISYGVTFKSCTLSWSVRETEAWCSTEVDGSGENISGRNGICEPACQPTKLPEDTNDEQKKVGKDLSTVSIVILVIIILIVSSITMVYYCYVKRNKAKGEKKEKEEQKDTLTNGNIAMINSYMVLNEQAAKQEISDEVISYNNGEYHVSDKLLKNIETNQKEKGQYALLR